MFKLTSAGRKFCLRVELHVNCGACQHSQPTWTDIAIRAAWNALAVIALLLDK